MQYTITTFFSSMLSVRYDLKKNQVNKKYNHCGREITSLPLTRGLEFDLRSSQFPGWGFFGDFSWPLRQMSGNLSHIRPPTPSYDHNLSLKPYSSVYEWRRSLNLAIAHDRSSIKKRRIISMWVNVWEGIRQVAKTHALKTRKRNNCYSSGCEKNMITGYCL